MTTRFFAARIAVLSVGVAALGLVLQEEAARGQGILIDRRPQFPIGRSFEVREVSVDARVRDQVAEVQVSQTFHNPGSVALEAEYTFPLPEDGTLENFVLLVDGREWPGRILPRDEARRIYEEIVRSRRDPALLEYMGRGLYRSSVFPIPPGADRKVTMRYTQVCKRDRDVVEFSFPFGTQKFTARPIERLAINLDLRSRDPIKAVYSPGDDLDIKRQGEHEARVSLVRHNVIPTADFRLVYTLAEGALGATVLSVRPDASEDGYFLILASPEVKAAEAARERPTPKTVVFVLDRSGSMAGKKLEQARRALRFVLENLHEDDTFNIVAYDDRVETFRPELQRYSSTTRQEAGRFIDNIREGGSTNIDAALRAAVGQVPDDSRPSYVLFLTDGLPTAGETRELVIAENCRKANDRRAHVFVFGVGFDVNARLLDRISGGNSGTSTYVKPDDNIEAHVARFASRLTSPALADIRVEFEQSDVNRVYPRDIPELFEGGQLIIAGRYRDSGPTTLRLTGKVGDERRRFAFPVELARAGAGKGSSHDFVERLWAMRRVGFIIDQIDLHGKSKELIDELVALSTRHGILTPYTSFLADERVGLHARAENNDRARIELDLLENVTGAQGVGQRAGKQSYLEARQSSESFATTPLPAASAATGAADAQITRNAGRSASLKPPGFGVAVKDAEGRDLAAATVRRVGDKTFYLKADGWVDSSINAEELARPVSMKQFSDDFFRLARGQGAGMNQYLTFQERVTVKLGDTVYCIEPDSR